MYLLIKFVKYLNLILQIIKAKRVYYGTLYYFCGFFLFSFEILNSFWNDVIGLNAVICWTRLLVRLGYQASLDLI